MFTHLKGNVKMQRKQLQGNCHQYVTVCYILYVPFEDVLLFPIIIKFSYRDGIIMILSLIYKLQSNCDIYLAGRKKDQWIGNIILLQQEEIFLISDCPRKFGMSNSKCPLILNLFLKRLKCLDPRYLSSLLDAHIKDLNKVLTRQHFSGETCLQGLPWQW